MAESKPEKVDISIQKSSPGDAGNDGSSDTAESKKQENQPAAGENKDRKSDSGKKQDARPKQDDSTISNVTRAYTDSETSVDQEQKEHEDTSSSTSMRQRKGKETKLEPLHSTASDSSEENTETTPEARSSANGTEATETDQVNAQEQPDESETEKPQEHAEEDEISDLPDSDFYSSKMDMNQASPEISQPSTADKQRKAVSEHFTKILLVFIIAVIAGLIVLYQLEQAHPGSGIIFDWFTL